MSPQNEWDVIIIGAGAAGLMCAAQAAYRGRQVLVLDNAKKPGRKILISGGGRCNFTNLYAGPQNFICRNPHFTKSALARYSQRDFIELALIEALDKVDQVLKDTDADLPSSGFNDQNSQDVVGAAGMHAFGFLADDQNNGESTITMKLANTSNTNDVKTTIVVKATVQNGTFTDVSVQE